MKGQDRVAFQYKLGFSLPPVRLILHPFSIFFELISPSGYIAVTLQEFKIIN